MVSVMPFRIEGSRDESSNQSELLFLESDYIQYRKTNTVAVIIFIRLSSVIIDCSKSKWQGPINITRSLGQRCVVRDFVKIWCCISKGDLVGQANKQFLWVVAFLWVATSDRACNPVVELVPLPVNWQRGRNTGVGSSTSGWRQEWLTLGWSSQGAISYYSTLHYQFSFLASDHMT